MVNDAPVPPAPRLATRARRLPAAGRCSARDVARLGCACPYDEAVAAMEARAAAIALGEADELVWLLEHPPLYTAGTSAKAADLVEPERFPVHQTGRGGQYTYHGPGQRIAYVMLDLNRRRPDLRAYVASLEAWLIASLDAFNVRAERREDRVGVWVRRPRRDRMSRTRSRRSASGCGAG